MDDLDIPAFLRRHQTPEQAADLKRRTARYSRPKIKNPPRRITRAMRARLPGMMFGHRQAQT